MPFRSVKQILNAVYNSGASALNVVITGTVALPTGAATSAKQDTGNTSLASIDGKLGSLGQKTMAASTPVAIASDQRKGNVGNSFGTVTTAATTKIIARTTAYSLQTVNAQRSMSSSSANDTAAGSGARTVKITYLNAAGAGPFTETITLNGTSAVNTVATDICHIEKMEVISTGTSLVNAGVITLFTAAAGGGSTFGTIGTGACRTFWCHHFIPADRTCYVTRMHYANTASASTDGAQFALEAFHFTNFAQKQIGDIGLNNGFSSASQIRPYDDEALEVVGPAFIVGYVTPLTVTAMTHGLGFDYWEKAS